MNRSKVLSFFVVALIVFLALVLVALLAKTQATTPTVTFIKETVVEERVSPICGTTEAIAYVTSTDPITVTTWTPSNLPPAYTVTIMTLSTVYTYGGLIETC